MDPRQQTSNILRKPFLESVSASINEEQGTIKMEVEGKHEEFTFYPMDPTSFYQVRIHYQKGSDEIKHIEVLPYAPEHANQHDSSHKKGPRKNARHSKKNPDAAKQSMIYVARQKFHIDCAIISGRTGEIIFKVWRWPCSQT